MLTLSLASVAGPSSATTMIPRLALWDFAHAWVGNNGDPITFSAYIGAPYNIFFPQAMSNDLIPSHCFDKPMGNLTKTSTCPSSSFPTMFTQAQTYNPVSVTDYTLYEMFTNIYLPAVNRNSQRYLSRYHNDMNVGLESLFITSLIPDIVASVLF